MSKSSQPEKIALFLQDNPNQRYTARGIAEAITTRYSEDYVEKRANPRFETEQNFIQQVIREIGAQKQSILNQSDKIKWQDKPRPRVYWFDDASLLAKHQIELLEEQIARRGLTPTAALGEMKKLLGAFESDIDKSIASSSQ